MSSYIAADHALNVCLEEIGSRGGVLLAECVDYRHAITVGGERRELRPIMHVRLPLGSPRFLRAAAELIVRQSQERRVTAYCGVGTQGIPLATACGLTTGLDAPYVRTTAATYGDGDRMLGGTPPSNAGRILLIDNVMYSGATLLRAANILRGRNWGLCGAIVVVAFEHPITRVQHEFETESILTAGELVEFLISKSYIAPLLAPSVRHFVEDQTAFYEGSEAHRRWIDCLRRSASTR